MTKSIDLGYFDQVWCVDFEFCAPPGERPQVICMVAIELHTGQKISLWYDELYSLSQPPFRIDDKSLFVAYYASAEMSCFLSLGWGKPTHILDLFTEYRNLRNGLGGRCGLIDALQGYGLDCIEAIEKESMRQLAMRGFPYNQTEKEELLNYCASDVEALVKLLPIMQEDIDLPRACVRGDYMNAAAHMEYNGVPIDINILERLKRNWDRIKIRLIDEVDRDYGVYEGQTFKTQKFAKWLSDNGIPWPRHPTEKLDLCDDTFKEMSRAFPEINDLRELRTTLGQLRLNKLDVGSDERNRTLLSAFRATTGRNQPSTSKFIYGPSSWARSLIKPKPGYGIAYIDWSQQEFAIAAALSGDPLMLAAYVSGDPYLQFAKQAGAVPDNATKKTHGKEREKFKQCVLAVQYGMGAVSLAKRINQPEIVARDLLNRHRETYKVFWQWSDAMLDYAMLYGELKTVLGWTVHVSSNPNPRSLRNFPMQANGAEMLRLACTYAIKDGIKVCAPVHDALLIEAPVEGLDDHIQRTQEAMNKASSVVLSGFEVRTGVEQLVVYPGRYCDARGRDMWLKIINILVPGIISL